MTGENISAIPTASHSTRISARWARLAGHNVFAPAERHSCRRDGTWQDDSDDRPAGISGVREVHLGSTSHCRSYQRDAELGDGAQEMVSSVQNSHLLRFC